MRKREGGGGERSLWLSATFGYVESARTHEEASKELVERPRRLPRCSRASSFTPWSRSLARSLREPRACLRICVPEMRARTISRPPSPPSIDSSLPRRRRRTRASKFGMCRRSFLPSDSTFTDCTGPRQPLLVTPLFFRDSLDDHALPDQTLNCEDHTATIGQTWIPPLSQMTLTEDAASC